MRFFQLRLTRNGKGAGVIALLGGIWIVASNRALYLWGGSSAAKSLASGSTKSIQPKRDAQTYFVGMPRLGLVVNHRIRSVSA